MVFQPMFIDGPTVLGLRLGDWLVVMAAAGLLAGLLWIRRITGIEPPDPAIWR